MLGPDCRLLALPVTAEIRFYVWWAWRWWVVVPYASEDDSGPCVSWVVDALYEADAIIDVEAVSTAKH